MKRALVFMASAALATALTAQARGQEGATVPAPEAAPRFEVVRLGDSGLSCEALVTEINGLNGRMAELQAGIMAVGQEMSRESMQAARRRPGGGLMSGLGGMAAGMIPGGGLVMGAVQAVEQQASAASARAQQDQMMERMNALSAGAADLGPISQRVDHLSEIARDRSC